MRLPTYIINLPIDTRKRDSMEAQIRPIDSIDAVFVNAVYGKELDNDFIELHVDKDSFFKRNKRNISLGEIGCAMSHKLVYNTIAQSDEKVALVLEDDVILKAEFMPKITGLALRISEIATPVAILLTPHFQYYLQDKVENWCEDESFYRLYNGIITAGYLINKAGAQLISNLSDRIYYLADDWKLFVNNGLTLYGIVPHLVSLAEIPSGIYDDVVKAMTPPRFHIISCIKSHIIYRINWMLGKRTSRKVW